MDSFVENSHDKLYLEECRSMLNKAIETYNFNLRHPQIIELSRKLDSLIVKAQLKIIISSSCDYNMIETCKKMLDKYISL